MIFIKDDDIFKFAVSFRWLENRINKYISWCIYENGFSGKGTTLLDKKPNFKKPWLPRILRRIIDAEKEQDAQRRQRAFRQACIEVLGEDPEIDW
jgi:hypothetical protein